MLCGVVFGIITLGVFVAPRLSPQYVDPDIVIIAPVFGLASLAARCGRWRHARARARAGPHLATDLHRRRLHSLPRPDAASAADSNGYIAVLTEDRTIACEWPTLGVVKLPNRRPSRAVRVHRIRRRALGRRPADRRPADAHAGPGRRHQQPAGRHHLAPHLEFDVGRILGRPDVTEAGRRQHHPGNDEDEQNPGDAGDDHRARNHRSRSGRRARLADRTSTRPLAAEHRPSPAAPTDIRTPSTRAAAS